MNKIISLRSPNELAWRTFEERMQGWHLRCYERDDVHREDWACVFASNITPAETTKKIADLKERGWKVQP